jgi:short-subunit dehydrogenase
MARRTSRSAPESGASAPRALVTGASSGIGAAFARALRARGEHLVLVARRAEKLQELVAELGGESVATAIPTDLTKPGSIPRLERELTSRGWIVDLLVNNAGLGHTGPFSEEPMDRVLGMIDLNIRAAAEMARTFLPGMVERGRGGIINVVSTSAFQPVPFFAVYAASKAFLLSLTEALATEVQGTGVRIQALCPGLTATEFQEVAETDRVAFNRTGTMTPDEVVAGSLRAYDRGDLRVIPGFSNRLLAEVQGWLPRSLVRRVAGELFRPRDSS